MNKVYACLTGNWVCLNDDPNCKMGVHQTDPYTWWEESAEIYAPTNLSKDQAHSLYHQNYIEIIYKGKGYRINPIFIQIVNE